MAPWWATRSAAASAAAAAGRASSAYRSFHAGNGRRLFRFVLNRHSHELNELLGEIKGTPIHMVTQDTIARTLRHSILARGQFVIRNFQRPWLVAAAVITGYISGYNIVAQRSADSSEALTQHEAK